MLRRARSAEFLTHYDAVAFEPLPRGICVVQGLIRILVVFTLLQLLSVTASLAQPHATMARGSHVAVVNRPAYPTVAWTRFCDQAPGECQVDLSEPVAIVLSSQVWERAVAINAWVNSVVRPVSDQDHWGVEDRWDYPTDEAGDCEDFQLLKRKLLVAAGLPRRSLRMTVVLDELGAGHAVLMMRTDRGDFILDNKVNEVLFWHETGYEFLKREGSEGLSWVALGSPAAIVATAKP